MTETTPDRIVCAAIKYKDFVVCGVRHFDVAMHSVLSKIPAAITEGIRPEQGFLTNSNRFVGREEAFWIAQKANQIIYKTGSPDAPILYSEDLW